MVRFCGAQPQGLLSAGCRSRQAITIKYLIYLVFLFLAGATAAAAEAPCISGLQLGLNAGLTRLVIEASGPLAADLQTSAEPALLTLTFPPGVTAQPLPGTAGSGLIERAGPLSEAGGRVTLPLILAAPALVERAFQLPAQGRHAPHRLVIDFRPADSAAFRMAFAAPVHLPLEQSADVVPPLPASRDNRRLIVLDPGHGGQDPGAISASGRYEKDVTLAVARAVAVRLEQTGRYRVLLTRNGDRFVRLPQRVALARQKEADLFLSIHADSLASDGLTRGASVYTRAEHATDLEAEALALRENKADLLADSAPAEELDDVVSILLDLASRDTPRLSGRFAGLLTASLGQATPLRRNAVRAANFLVLSAPDVPSVLLELGYLSNLKDEALLFSDQGRRELAEAVVAAIDRFFGVEAQPAR